MSLADIRAALSVIAEHQTFIAKAQMAFAPVEDADEANQSAYIDLRRFSARFLDYTNYTGRAVRGKRTHFMAWESARIREALHTVAEQQERAAAAADEATLTAGSVAAARTATADADAARVTARAARRLIRQYRFAWLIAFDRLSGLSTQRLLHPQETEALRLAVRIAGERVAVAEMQLEKDFNVTVSKESA